MSMKSAWAKLAVVVAVAAGVCVEEVRGETSYWLRPGPGVDGIYYDTLVGGLYDPLQEGVAVARCTNNVRVVNIPSHVNLKVIYLDSDTGDQWEETINFRVTGVQAGAFQGNTAVESVTIPAGVESWWGWGPRNTPIRGNVFAGCTSLTEVNLPDDMKSIEPSMFSGCTSLPSVTIPASVESFEGYAFRDCTSLTGLNLPDGLQSIGPAAFYGCTALSSMTIPGSVGTCGNQTFWGCSSLAELKLGEGVKDLGTNAFSGCMALESVSIPASLESWESGVFSGRTNLTEVKLASGLKSIGAKAFSGCTALPSVTIPSSVEILGNDAFSGCRGLISLSLAHGLKIIGANAFSGCTALPTVTIPNSVQEIGGSAFSGCTALPTVTIPGSVGTVAVMVFSGCSGLTNVVFGAGLESVGTNAFYGCYRLPKVVLPTSMREIGASAFSGCTALASVELGGTETIGDKAFEGCTGLKAVSFPAGVRRIGAGAFSGCTGLATVALPSGVEEVDAGAFSGASVKSLYFDNADGGLLDAFSKESLRTLYLGADARGITGELLGDCLSLSALLVAKGNPEYAVDGAGALYDKDFTRLIKYPAGAAASSYTVPATVRTVDAKAFAHATALREVVFQGPVTEIGEDAFDWCIALERVVFPSGAGTVGAGAFRVCPSLETLRFEGTGLYSVPTFGEGQFLYAKPVVQFDESETSRWISILSSLGLSYEWIVDADATSTTPVPVPKSWIQSKAGHILSACGGDYEAAAMAPASNGVSKVWECYLQGVDPEDGDDRFQLRSKVEDGGVSMWWEPDLGTERKYALEGVENMGDEWGETNAGTRFYRARVEMP